MMQEKEIIITNLSTRAITPKPGGKQFTAFSVYNIQGNDGITYETTQKDYFSSLAIGNKIKIKFHIDTKTSNGRVYTSYKLDLPKKADPVVAELESKIFARLDLMEKNIISAFKVITTKSIEVEKTIDLEEDPNQLSLFPEDDESALPDSEDEPPY